MSQPTPLPAMRLAVSPRSVRAGARTRFRFRITGTDSRPLQGATIRFAGRRAHANRNGRATISVTLRRPGRRFARVTKPGFRPARATVKVRRR